MNADASTPAAPTVAPYGTWRSPITAHLITAKAVGLGPPIVDGETLYWLEQRPQEAGRTVLVRLSEAGFAEDVTPAPFNCRSRVHEYGGGAVAVRDGVIVFSNFADNRVYVIEPGSDRQPRALTPEDKLRYADFQIDLPNRRVIAVREDHRVAGEPANALVAISLDPGPVPNDGRVLAAGADFYAYPRISPDRRRLAWIDWNHPNMPWDGTRLCIADLRADGRLGPIQVLAGGDGISVLQPTWAPDGVLHYLSDESGWWNIFRWRQGAPEPAAPMAADFGFPLWSLGTESFGFLKDGRLVARYSVDGRACLGLIDGGLLRRIDTPYASTSLPRPLGEDLVLLGAAADRPTELALWRLGEHGARVIARASSLELDPAMVSTARPIRFPTTGGREAFGYHYPPANGGFIGPDGEKPPLIVISHGGPTGAAGSSFSLAIQFWTTRGFAVVDVNYGGSTGHGRAYRARLDGQWGVVDVDDCCAAARYLVEAGEADPDRLIIRGGSAGGFTTLAALTFRDVFRAGASHYGIGDLMALARETHKFESRYLDRLIGPLPEAEALYRERSPIHHAEKLNCPVIFFQGLDDKVVPPNQAETMVAALKAKGIPVAYVPFEGEGHGFRKAENIKTALESELAFYGRVLGFTPADDLPALAIANL